MPLYVIPACEAQPLLECLIPKLLTNLPGSMQLQQAPISKPQANTGSRQVGTWHVQLCQAAQQLAVLKALCMSLWDPREDPRMHDPPCAGHAEHARPPGCLEGEGGGRHLSK